MTPLTLVFDLDGTLVDTAPDLVAATNHALADLGIAPVPMGVLRDATGHGARAMLVTALASTKITLPEHEIDRLLALFLQYYEAHIAVESRPFPGVVAALDRCRAEGAVLAVCTNKREALSRSLLDALGLSRYFAAIAGRDTFPVSKPDPGHLTGAIAMAGGDVARAVMIGDSRVDAAAAKAAGVPMIACSFGYSDAPAETFGAAVVIDHFDELGAAVEAVVGGFAGASGG